MKDWLTVYPKRKDSLNWKDLGTWLCIYRKARRPINKSNVLPRCKQHPWLPSLTVSPVSCSLLLFLSNYSHRLPNWHISYRRSPTLRPCPHFSLCLFKEFCSNSALSISNRAKKKKKRFLKYLSLIWFIKSHRGKFYLPAGFIKSSSRLYSTRIGFATSGGKLCSFYGLGLHWITH